MQFLLKYKETCKDINLYIFEGYSDFCFYINSDFWWPMAVSAWKGYPGFVKVVWFIA